MSRVQFNGLLVACAIKAWYLATVILYDVELLLSSDTEAVRTLVGALVGACGGGVVARIILLILQISTQLRQFRRRCSRNCGYSLLSFSCLASTVNLVIVVNEPNAAR